MAEKMANEVINSVSSSSSQAQIPSLAAAAVLVDSVELPEDTPTVLGYDFNNGIDYDALLKSYLYSGFQATNFGEAVNEINRMVGSKCVLHRGIKCLDWRLSDEPIPDDETEEFKDIEMRKNVKCKIFFGYTSNLISSGLREIFRYLVQHKMVDVIVSTAGGIEEDFIKCLARTYVGDFALKGSELREKGLNRIGNLLVPNINYCKFEEWMFPLLDKMLRMQKEDGVVWSPSKMIAFMGKEINNEESVYYWAYKNDIPVFCPALTDGSIGDMLYFHSFSHPGLVLDIVGDIRAINNEALHARKTGMLILGGGMVKHHICNANLMRNGADFSVFVNTANEFDGSDAGARPDEAVSWGKIRVDAKPVKIYGEATLVFPLLVAQTFAKSLSQR